MFHKACSCRCSLYVCIYLSISYAAYLKTSSIFTFDCLLFVTCISEWNSLHSSCNSVQLSGWEHFTCPGTNNTFRSSHFVCLHEEHGYLCWAQFHGVPFSYFHPAQAYAPLLTHLTLACKSSQLHSFTGTNDNSVMTKQWYKIERL